MVIVISFAHEHNTAPNYYAPELKRLEKKIQSLTKLNDKMIYEDERYCDGGLLFLSTKKGSVFV